MSEQTLLARIARTNAYPADEWLPMNWLGGVLETDTQGSDLMSIIQKQRSVEPEATPPTPKRWKGAIAAIAVIVVAIAAIVIVNRDSNDVIETPTTTAITEPTVDAEPAPRLAVAESIVDAFYSPDAQQLVDTIGDVSGSDEMIDYREFLNALNVAVASRRPCSDTGSGVVFCETRVDADITRALEYQAFHAFRIDFLGPAGTEIIEVRFSIEPPQSAFGEFQRWVVESYPDVYDVDCAGAGPFGDDPTRCALALSSLTAEFNAIDASTGP